MIWLKSESSELSNDLRFDWISISFKSRRFSCASEFKKSVTLLLKCQSELIWKIKKCSALFIPYFHFLFNQFIWFLFDLVCFFILHFSFVCLLFLLLFVKWILFFPVFFFFVHMSTVICMKNCELWYFTSLRFFKCALCVLTLDINYQKKNNRFERKNEFVLFIRCLFVSILYIYLLKLKC